RVEASEGVDEPAHLRQRVPLVHPGDLVAGVDVQRRVDCSQRLVVAAEQDEGRPFPVPGNLRAGHPFAGGRDRTVVFREGPLVVFAPHVPLRPIELLSENRGGFPTDQFYGRKVAGHGIAPRMPANQGSDIAYVGSAQAASDWPTMGIPAAMARRILWGLFRSRRVATAKGTAAETATPTAPVGPGATLPTGHTARP